MLSIYAPPTFDEATSTLGIRFTYDRPPSRTLPPALKQKGDRNYMVCLAVYDEQEQRMGEWNCTFRRRVAKDRTNLSWMESLFDSSPSSQGAALHVDCTQAERSDAQAPGDPVSSMALSTPPGTPLSPLNEGKITVSLATRCGWVCSENEMMFLLDRRNGVSIRSCQASFLFFDTLAHTERPVEVQDGGVLKVKSPIVERPQLVQVTLLCDSQPMLQQISFVYTDLAL